MLHTIEDSNNKGAVPYRKVVIHTRMTGPVDQYNTEHYIHLQADANAQPRFKDET